MPSKDVYQAVTYTNIIRVSGSASTITMSSRLFISVVMYAKYDLMSVSGK